MGQKQDRREAREALQSVGDNLGAREAQHIANQTGLSVQQIANIATNQGVNVRPAVTAPTSPPGPTSPPPGTTYGYSYSNSNNPGANYTVYSNQPINSFGGAPSPAPAPAANVDVDAKISDALAAYQSRFDEVTRSYQSALSDSAKYKSDYESALSESAKYKSDYEDYKAKYDALDAERKAAQEAQVSQQLSSLRSGSVASGVPGSGLGSLTSGSSAYSRGSGGSGGGVLSRYWRNSDPTDSVLDREGPVVAAIGDFSGSMAARSEARHRALARGAGSSYYDRRFGSGPSYYDRRFG